MVPLSPKFFSIDPILSPQPKATLKRAQALNSAVPQCPQPDCSTPLHIGMFFDGTGNNREADYLSLPSQKRKHSNIVRLYNVYAEQHETGYYKYYIPGVGTPFPIIGDAGAALGGPFAWNGQNRITWALLQILNASNRFVNGKDLLEPGYAGWLANDMAPLSAYPLKRQIILKQLTTDLASKLKSKKPSIKYINLSVFGFSRGSAEARAFANWLFEACETKNGKTHFAGIEIRLTFLGIFDTVASVGIPNSLPNLIMEGHQSWADGNMEVHPSVERCVHFVAAHEVRASFPLDSVRVRGTYPPNVKEVIYPGSHSDLGGGYAPNELGISPSISDMFAIIPCADMYREARTAGVPLRAWKDMTNAEKTDLTPSEACIRSFNNYLKATTHRPLSVEEAHRHHMSLYLSFRYKYRNTLAELPFYKRAVPRERRFLFMTTKTIIDRLRRLNGYNIPPTDPDYSLNDAISLTKKMMKAAGLESQDRAGLSGQLYDVVSTIDTSKLTPEIETFFNNYVHDSMAGFIGMMEPVTDEYKVNGQGILRFRKIFKENG